MRHFTLHVSQDTSNSISDSARTDHISKLFVVVVAFKAEHRKDGTCMFTPLKGG